jgi:DNA helicase II / ATP-dependent DNA helicase PcrA
VLEDALLRAGVPYQIVGGTRFFDRAEIRDVMAYVKVVVNPADEIALKRIINKPKRGIGDTVEKVEFEARERGRLVREAMRAAAEEWLGTGRALSSPPSSSCSTRSARS